MPIIALSQLSRAPEPRKGELRKPQLADLRDSGSIEQDADVVVFLYREELYDKDTERKGIADVIIAKQRNGPTGDFSARLSRRPHDLRQLRRRPAGPVGGAAVLSGSMSSVAGPDALRRSRRDRVQLPHDPANGVGRGPRRSTRSSRRTPTGTARPPWRGGSRREGVGPVRGRAHGGGRGAAARRRRAARSCSSRTPSRRTSRASARTD